MPSRQLPYTDKMKYEAMKTAIEVTESLSVHDRAISKTTFDELLSTFSRFEQIYKSREKLKHDNDYKALRNKARMYIEHYLQVTMMAVEREEFPADTLAYYGLKPGSKKLPDLRTDKKLIDFGKFLFEADSKRILEGGKYITNPGIAVVKVWFEKFVSTRKNHQVQVDKYKQTKTFIDNKRLEAKLCIRKVWDEIEEAYSHLSPSLRRKAAIKYGVIYIDNAKERQSKYQPENGTLFTVHDIPEQEPELHNIREQNHSQVKRREHISEKQSNMFS
ncbi:MAG: hypothetical protein PF590_09525 [Candidatus Delongbacteria bacterium]|nr:hypothetical protein [Candidatus Delongbacteria bacterium]